MKKEGKDISSSASIAEGYNYLAKDLHGGVEASKKTRLYTDLPNIDMGYTSNLFSLPKSDYIGIKMLLSA